MPNLETSNLALSSLILTLYLLPGITWSLIWMKYSKTRPQTDKFYFSVYAIFASAFCYLGCWAILAIFGFKEDLVIKIFQEKIIDSPKLKIIFFSTAIGLIFGIFSVIGSHKKWVIRLMNFCRITSRDGEDDIWESSLRNSMGRKSFIKIYDFKRDFVYFGFVDQISESKTDKELVLLEVEIFSNSTGKVVNRMKKLYLVFDHKDFLIQFFN
jgi:hypothetical protein